MSRDNHDPDRDSTWRADWSGGFLALVVRRLWLLGVAGLAWFLAGWTLREVITPILLLVLTAGLSYLIWKIPQVQAQSLDPNIDITERAKLENEYRTTLVHMIGGLAIFSTLFFSWRQVVATEDGKVTDRFSKAVELIGNTSPECRIGGIYALERIASDSERDHQTVMELLSAFVRTEAHRSRPRTKRPSLLPSGAVVDEMFFKNPLRGDLQAALSVICRSRRSDLELSPHSRLNLSRCDLPNAQLINAQLANAFLMYSNLENGIIDHADLRGAFLSDGDLWAADLDYSNLEGSNLRGCMLRGARLVGVNLDGADLSFADIRGVRSLGDCASATNANIYGIQAAKKEIETLLKKGAVEIPSKYNP